MASADSKNLYIPLAPIVGEKQSDGSYKLSAMDIKNLNDNLYAIAKKIQGGLTLADLTSAANTEFEGKVSFTNLETGGETVINGDNITTGTVSADRLIGETLQGVTFISTNPSAATETIQIDNGEITLGQSAYGGQLKFDGTKVYLISNLSPLKLESLMNLSIDAGSSYTIYIGTSNNGTDITIGNSGGALHLVGSEITANGAPVVTG